LSAKVRVLFEATKCFGEKVHKMMKKSL